MKKSRLAYSLAIIGALMASWAFAPKAESEKYVVDTKASTLAWSAKKVTGEHYGNVSIASGEIWTEGKTISKGKFAIDMTTITVTDITNKESNTRLVNHLKSEDFFGVENHTEAAFVITSIKPISGNDHTVKGKLTIKGKSNEIEFPASVKIEGSKITAKAKITVDRTKYDIKYRSGSFFDSLGDKMIYDNFDLDLSLIATLQKGS